MAIENTFGNINFNGVDLSDNNIFVQHYPLMGAPSRRQTAISGVAHRNAVFDEKEYDNVDVELDFVIVADTFDELSERRAFLFRTLDVGGYVPVKIDPDPFIYYMYRTSDMKETLFDGNPLNWIRVITVTFSRDPFKYYDVSSSRPENNIGQVNQLFNTEFSPDFAGWYLGQSTSANDGIYATGTLISSSTGWSLDSQKYNGSNVIRNTPRNSNGCYSDLIPVKSGTKISISMAYYNSADYNSTVPLAFYLRYYDTNKKHVRSYGLNNPVSTSFKNATYTSTVPSNVAYVSFNILNSGGTAGSIWYSQPMLVFSDHVGTYVQGLYDPYGSYPITTSGTTISNQSNYESLPKITIYANTGNGITNVNINGVIQLKNVNGNIVLDSMLEDAYWLDSSGNYVNGNSSMVKPYFPKLQPNLNAITFDSTVSKVVITPRWRTL